jgi:glucuronyl/N-acetylglucosaminyl transferase EXT1
MNFIISDVTKLPPIKVTHRKVAKETMLPSKAVNNWSNSQVRFKQRQSCVAALAQVFGYMPLVRSKSRMDPVLWKDPVSNLRKKYHQLEVI